MTYDTYMEKLTTPMETSTLVLTALLQLNDQLMHDDAFCGYSDDYLGHARLLDELWELYTTAHVPADTPEELVNAWYEQFYAQEELLCAG